MTRQFRTRFRRAFTTSVILVLTALTKLSDAGTSNVPCDSFSPCGGIKELPAAILDGLVNGGRYTPQETIHEKGSVVLVTCKWTDPNLNLPCPSVTLLLQGDDGSGRVQPSQNGAEKWALFPPDRKTYNLVIVSSRYRLVGNYQIQWGQPIDVLIESVPVSSGEK